jgi:hypothetical protein
MVGLGMWSIRGWHAADWRFACGRWDVGIRPVVDIGNWLMVELGMWSIGAWHVVHWSLAYGWLLEVAPIRWVVSPCFGLAAAKPRESGQGAGMAEDDNEDEYVPIDCMFRDELEFTGGDGEVVRSCAT